MKGYIYIVGGKFIFDAGVHENEYEAREYIEGINCLPYVLIEYNDEGQYKTALRHTWHEMVKDLID